MSRESTHTEKVPPRRRRPPWHSRREAASDTAATICGHGRPISAVECLENPIASMIAVEELCWRFARDEWRGRRPSPFRLRRWRAWRAEGRSLRAKQRRIAAMAAEIT